MTRDRVVERKRTEIKILWDGITKRNPGLPFSAYLAMLSTSGFNQNEIVSALEWYGIVESIPAFRDLYE